MLWSNITFRSACNQRIIAALLCAILASLSFTVSIEGQNNANVKSTASLQGTLPQQGGFFLSAPPAYRKDVSRLLIQEVNRVAKELSLSEKLPISVTNAVKLTIYPPRFAGNMGAIGNVVTSNYIYYVSVGQKFSALTRTDLQQEDNQLKSKFIEPINQMDTNAAFQLATQFLAAASMDVTALNHNCDVHIGTTPAGQDSEHFVPLYWVSWVEKGKGEQRGNAASVELFLPAKSLRQMHVNNSKYILRQPLQINPEFLLVSTNPPTRRFTSFGSRQNLMSNLVMRTNGLNKPTMPIPVFNRPVANNR